MLLLWILSLAASFLLPANGEVVRNFKSCSQFFLDKKPPKPSLKPMNPARICQYCKEKYRFATMYDRDRHIPLFSAYKYQPGRGRRDYQWMIEPQLALPEQHKKKSMDLERYAHIDHKLLARSQAVSEDYKDTIYYDRGHLTPMLHQPDPDSKNATFTLTNIVPQFRQLNQGKWAEYERNMKRKTTGCHDTYVIVGVVPGSNFIATGRVNIPSHIWAAACCVSEGNRRRSWAVSASNDQNVVDQRTLRELEVLLGKYYQKKKIDLFNGACYSGDTLQNEFREKNTTRVLT
ncbi:endonuclease domain-containing 1 protein-like [Candoia aspera]|uniref:endonuclease domain-containing 1 protein-like n=1 Tax=Candoia aspera TaxID=51853 RepID=UPI002FD864C4